MFIDYKMKHITIGLAAFGLLVCFQATAQEIKCLFSTSFSEVGGAEDIHGAHSSMTNSFYLKVSSEVQLDSISTNYGQAELTCNNENKIHQAQTPNE